MGKEVYPQTIDWHSRFQEQALWTQQLRKYVYTQQTIKLPARVLDVGCGTGVLLEETGAFFKQPPFGIDLSLHHILQIRSKKGNLSQADAHALPFTENSFDVCLCHFLLLWLTDPLAALLEMKRVTRPGGAILVLAEPDYAGRIDYPVSLEPIGKMQAQALTKQGADPNIGRKLRGLFHRAGLCDVCSGLIGGEWKSKEVAATHEWQVFENDVSFLDNLPSQDEMEYLHELEVQATNSGERVLFVPIFYAWGYVKK